MMLKLKNQLDLADQKVIVWMKAIRSTALDKTLSLLTHTGSGKAWLIFSLTMIALQLNGYKILPAQDVFMTSMLSVIPAWIFGIVIKKFVSKERPENTYNLIKTPVCGSFPSNHTAASMTFFVALFLRNHPAYPYVGLWAALISYSRMYLGVHYLTDVLGGVFLAISCACLHFLLF